MKIPLNYLTHVQCSRLTTLIALLLAGAFSVPAQAAATATWTGATNGTWSTSTNWSPSGAPSTTAVFNASSSNTTVTLSAATSIGNINFDASAANYTIGTTGGNALDLSDQSIIQILSTLTATNAVETVNAPILLTAYSGTRTLTFANNSANGSGAGAGTLDIGGAISVNVGNSTLYLSGSNTNANTVSGAISNGTAVFSLDKIGVGTWDLSGANTYTGSTVVTDGTLVLNFAGASSPTSPIISSSSVLTLGGGATLTIRGASGASSSQTFANTSISAGANTMDFIQNGATSLSLTLGVITRSVGSTLNFILPSAGFASGSSSNGVGTGGIILGYDAAYATVNGNDWAAISGGDIVGLSTVTTGGYTPTTATTLGSGTNPNVDVASGVTATTYGGGSIDSLRFNQNQATKITLTGQTRVDGILVTSAMGSNTSTITGSEISSFSNNGADFAIIQDDPNGVLSIASQIVNGGTGDPLTISGDGTVDLANTTNTYSGATYINGALVNIAADLSLGAAPTTATASDLEFNGGTLQLGNNITLNSNRGISIGNDGGATIDTNGYSGSYGGIIASVANASGGFTKTGLGSFTLSGVNIYSNGTTVNAGTLYVNGGTAGSSTSSGVGSGPVTVKSGGTLAGNGNIAVGSPVTVNAGGNLASGGAQSTAPNITGTGITFTNSSVVLSGTGAGALSANLTFDLGANHGGAVGSFHSFSSPNTNSTFMTLSGTSTLNFTAGSTESVSLVDLTNGNLSLRAQTPYLLISAGSDADYLNLVINSGTTANPILSLSQNDSTTDGYVLGVWAGGTNALTDYSAININQFGSNGMTPLVAGSTAYYSPDLYLNGGNLEVVPEPATWALMFGGLSLLVLIQRRKGKQS
jgi:autotransporter-associated beta strand protein